MKAVIIGALVERGIISRRRKYLISSFDLYPAWNESEGGFMNNNERLVDDNSTVSIQDNEKESPMEIPKS